MKTYIASLVLVLLGVFATPCVAQERSFPEIGKSYVIQFAAPRGEFGPTTALNNGSVVKVVGHAKGGWYEIEFGRDGWDEKAQKKLTIIEKLWLNFDLVLIAKELDEKRRD